MTTEHFGRKIDAKDGYDIIECEVCGFTHVSPLPTFEELDTFYKEAFYVTEKPTFFKQKQEDEAWLNLQYSDRYDTFEQHLPSTRRRVLDVGAGAGYFLKHGQSRGWTVKGIEPSPQAVEYARSMGVDQEVGYLTSESAGQLGQFDVIHASLVLEHVPNPIELIRIMYGMLTEGGIICISTPNDYNPFQQALRDVDKFQPWWVCPQHHLNYFSPDSLQQLLEKHAFTVLRKEASFPIDMFLLMGDNYVGDNTLGRACHHKRVRFETRLAEAGKNDVKRHLYQALAELNLGREICIYGQK
ncbi:class I SAM-dependent methyltransferase [Shewanella xiamenensis]|uniref:class I SAM-dependent methyltransferase n=1 Tax=Shewanella xiamenensis TaxID=332186 RepID=UPI00313D68C8